MEERTHFSYDSNFKIPDYYMKEPYLVKTFEEFLFRLKVIPEKSRRIIEARCTRPKKLATKLGVEYVSEEYSQAKNDMANAKYVMYLEDSETMDFELAIKIGKLLKVYFSRNSFYFGKIELEFIGKTSGQKLLECIERLPTDQKEILVLHFGLGDTKAMSFKKIAETKGVNVQRIFYQERKAMKSLKKLHQYFSKVVEKYSCELDKLLAQKRISNKAYYALRRHGIVNIQQLQTVSEKEIKSIRGVGAKIFAEIIELKNKA